MARPLWTGSLSFGLVNVPVRLVSSVRDRDLHFRQLHERDGTPIEMQRWCSAEQREVPYGDIARSYEFDDGTEVIVSDEELDALEPRRTRTIEIEQFVALADVDPIHFDHPYLVAPAAEDEGALRAYKLLLEVMARSDRAALGRLVMRTKEYLAIVRARDGILALTTMRLHDEVRPTEDVDGARDAKVPNAQRDHAIELIEALTVDWDPARYEDDYRARLAQLVERKRKGETIKAPEAVEEPSPVPDLMAALRESLEAAKSAGGRARPEGEDLGELTREELYERAQDLDVPGRSSMSKKQLVAALSERS